MTPLVSIVSPAFNAESTIDETLRSVRFQTVKSLEIIIVDDGSTDATLQIAKEHASFDNRIRIITQSNEGVAAARNTGWRQATSDLIAFIDADDIWSPSIIERLLTVIELGGAEVGLVYSWYASIDSKSNILHLPRHTLHRGDVLDAICAGNFIGNGSSVLVRRAALLHANGFDSRLLKMNAQGCEDFLLYFRIAESFKIDVVPEYLVGYRRHSSSMSENLSKMLRSFILVTSEMALRYPSKFGTIRSGLLSYSNYLMWYTCSRRRYFGVIRIIITLAKRHPHLALRQAYRAPRVILRSIRHDFGALGKSRYTDPNPKRFLIGDIDQCR